MNKIFAYRNLNQKGVVWSLKDTKTRLVVNRVQQAYFENPKFKVSQAGRIRVLKENRKNVHAGVEGTLLEVTPQVTTWSRARYNPYEYGTFVDENNNPVLEAKYAMLNSTGLWFSKE